MRHLNKIASVVCVAAMGLLVMTGCEGGDLYTVDNPDWIAQKIDSIEKAKVPTEDEVLEGMMEDVYTVGNVDYSSGWWSSFTKYYQIKDGEKWNAVFSLNINPSDNTYYKNYALIITNDVDRGGAGYTEYGAIRFDATNDSASYNSQWGSYLYFKFTETTMPLNPDDSNADANLQKMGGKVTLTVDRSDPEKFFVKMTNGTVTKTYTQPYPLPNLNDDPSNNTIRCFIVPEGSYINFLETNIEPIGGLTSALDKAPLSMVLQNVPDEVDLGTTLEEAVANVSAVVTFEEGVTKTVPASELYFTAVPDMDQLGEKTLVVIYNKTFKGENADQPIVASATFKVVDEIKSIEVTRAPDHTHYYYYTSLATEGLYRSLAFDPTGMEVVGTYGNGSTSVVNNAKLYFSEIPAEEGVHTVTVYTENGKSAEVDVTVSESKCTFVTPNPTVFGPEDNSGGFWSAHTDNINIPAGETYGVKFTNYSSLSANWNNFVVVLRSSDNATEYAVVRADDFGWGIGYDACVHSGPQYDWASWLSAMNGAKVTCYITNCNNGTADVQAIMEGTDGNTYIQYYLGVNCVNIDDFNFAFTIDGCHMVFE